MTFIIIRENFTKQAPMISSDNFKYSPLLWIVKCSLTSNFLPDTGISSVYYLTNNYCFIEHTGHLASLQSTPRGATSGKGLHYLNLLLYIDMLLCHRTFRTVILCIIFSRSQRELETESFQVFAGFARMTLARILPLVPSLCFRLVGSA